MSALWCPLATPSILLGFLLPWAWGISSWLLQQSAAAAPYLGRGASPHCRPPDLERGVAPLGPPGPAQPLLLGRGVTSLGRRPCLGYQTSNHEEFFRCPGRKKPNQYKRESWGSVRLLHIQHQETTKKCPQHTEGKKVWSKSRGSRRAFRRGSLS